MESSIDSKEHNYRQLKFHVRASQKKVANIRNPSFFVLKDQTIINSKVSNLIRHKRQPLLQYINNVWLTSLHLLQLAC